MTDSFLSIVLRDIIVSLFPGVADNGIPQFFLSSLKNIWIPAI